MATTGPDPLERYLRGDIDYLMFAPNPNFDLGTLSAYANTITPI